MTAVLFVGALLLIALACELFTNAVEWAGQMLHLGAGATGSLLAALGTALPETMVVVVALVGGVADSDQIAIGAVLGSSFLLLTLGGAITGLALMARARDRRLRVAPAHVRRDLGVFLSAFGCAVASTLVTRPERVVIGVLLLLLYAGYARSALREKETPQEAPEPLHFVRWRSGPPPAAVVGLQLLIGTVLLAAASELFVGAIHSAASSLGISALILAVIAIPFATELPETLNSVLWIRAGDDDLAFGNVAGAAAFQACVLGFVGITFTTWQLGAAGLLSAGCAFATGIYLLCLLRKGGVHGGWLLLAALPWLGFVAAELISAGRLG
jgi:cation:H+ antiporter